MRHRAPSSIDATAVRTALLIDLDNVTIVGERHLSGAELEVVLRWLRAQGDCAFTLAIAPRATLVRYAPALARCGVRWRVCSGGRDAADEDLVRSGRELRALGYTDLFIASRDHYFASLAVDAALIVLNPLDKPVAAALRNAATRVLVGNAVDARLPAGSLPTTHTSQVPLASRLLSHRPRKHHQSGPRWPPDAFWREG